MRHDPLEKPAQVSLIRRLEAGRLLRPDEAAQALSLVRPPEEWWRWINRMLLFLGAGLFLSGVIFFFAYNWRHLGRWLEFGLIEAGVIACVLAALGLGLDRLSARVTLAGAAVLVGALLAVFGQNYQTGADSFELFYFWAALIVPLCLSARLAGLWMLWALIVNAATVLLVFQVGGQDDSNYWLSGLGLTNAAGVATVSVLVHRGMDWLDRRWSYVCLVILTLLFASVPTMGIHFFHGVSLAEGVGLLVWLGLVVAGAVFFRFRRRDILALALVWSDIVAVSLWQLYLVLEHLFRREEHLTLLFTGIVIILTVSVEVVWLRSVRRRFQEET